MGLMAGKDKHGAGETQLLELKSDGQLEKYVTGKTCLSGMTDIL